jgi:SAM-dependent methyltransferase
VTSTGGSAIFGNNPDRDWERFGAEDPYYSILNTEAYRRHSLDDRAIEEIFQSGENTVEGVLRFADRRFGPLQRRSALEYGCGVGRLQLALSKRFEFVMGVDVSPSMLREAELHCQRTGTENVQLLLSDDELSRVESTFDFIVSYLVFQHIPTRRGEAVIRQLLKRLNLGGVAALHLTTSRSSPRWRHLVHILRRNILPVHYVANAVSGMHWNEPLMQTNLYDFDRILEIADSEGIGEFALHRVQYGDHVGVMLFFYRGPSGYAIES